MFVSTATSVAPSAGMVATNCGPVEKVVKFSAAGWAIPAYGLPAASSKVPLSILTK